MGTAVVEFLQVFEVRGQAGEMVPKPIIGYASTARKAQEMAKGKGYFGDGTYIKVPGVKIDGFFYVLTSGCPTDLDNIQADRDAELRDSTLASLTVEQKRVLGL